MKIYPNKIFGNIIPNTEALKNCQKFLKISSFTEIREFFEIPILSKTEKKLMHCVLDQTHIRIIAKNNHFNNIYG